MQCPQCTREEFTKAGRDRQGRQLYRCRACASRMTDRSKSAFSGYRFPDDVIALAVRWYLRYRLSYVEVTEWLAERGISVDPSTIYDWVRAFTPRFIAKARSHRSAVGHRWQVDETYIRLNGRWTYVYRAIDQQGQVVDTYFSERRNAKAAQAFFERAIDAAEVRPVQVTTGYPQGEGEVLSARPACCPTTCEAPDIEVPQQWLGTGSPAPEATAVSHAGLQTGGLGRPPHPRPRVHPKPAQRFLHTHRHRPTPAASFACVVTTGPGDLARAAAPLLDSFAQRSALPSLCPLTRNRTVIGKRRRRPIVISFVDLSCARSLPRAHAGRTRFSCNVRRSGGR